MKTEIIDDFLCIGTGTGGKNREVYHCPKLRSLCGKQPGGALKTKAPLDKGAGLYDPKICDIIAKTNV
jgi:hypothetical protein